MVKKISVLLAVLLVFTLSAFPVGAYDSGVVTASVLNVRSGAGTGYSIVGQLSYGQAVQINEYINNGWLKILYNGSNAYVCGQYVSVRSNQVTSRSGSHAEVHIDSDAYVNADNLNFRFEPKLDSAIIAVLPKYTAVYVGTDVGNGWGKIAYNGVIGYVSLQYITLGKYSAPASSKGQQVVDYAKQFMGASYVYGGNGPTSFDCSGFTVYVYSHFGVTLNRVACDQALNGTYVDRNNLMPGDLVLFAGNGYIGHVGIYIGNDQFIHASTNSYSVRIDNLSGYYGGIFHSGRRIF